ncbi:DUF4118 domain-containing protein [Streptomyces sp. JNUCC 64]
MRVRIPSRHDRLALTAGLVLPPATAAALVPARGLVTSAVLALALAVAVVAVAVLGCRAAAVLAAVGAAWWFDLLLTRPYGSPRVTDPGDLVTALLLLVIGLAVARTATRARRSEAVTVADGARIAALRDTARLTERRRAPQDVVELARRELVAVLGLRGCRFEYGTLLGRPPRLEPDGTVTVDGRPRDVERRGWPTGETELRATAGGRFVGRFLLDPGEGAVTAPRARTVAVTLADQAAAGWLAATAAAAPTGS